MSIDNYSKELRNYISTNTKFINDNSFKSKEQLAENTIIIEKYIEKEKSSVILISHVMEEVAQVCSKILVLEKGRQIYYDTPENVFKSEEKLKHLGLGVPQVKKIMDILSQQGFELSKDILTVEKAKSEILRLLKIGGEKSD